MNENTNLLAAMYVALNQIQSMKDKVDPEAYELLSQAGHEAISSAHHFLDACEKILDSFVDGEAASDSIDNEDIDNIVPLNTREG